MNANNRAAGLSRYGKKLGRPAVEPEDHRMTYQQLRVTAHHALNAMGDVAMITPALIAEFDRTRPAGFPAFADLREGLKLLAMLAASMERR